MAKKAAFFESDHDPNSEIYLSSLQRRINDSQLDLNVRPPLPERSPQVDLQAFELYLDVFNHEKYKVAARTLMDHLRLISMDELQRRVRENAINLNTKLMGMPYGLIVERDHSQEWVAQLSLRHLNTLPSCLIDTKKTLSLIH